MAKAHRKALAGLKARQEKHEITTGRQKSGNFRPNATGGIHLTRKPGSMNPKKGIGKAPKES